MSPQEEWVGEFEQRVRGVLEESVCHVEGHVRSRLTQARHTALAEVGRRPSLFRRFVLRPLMPTAGVAAAALVAFVLWPHSPQGGLSVGEGTHTTVEDLDLLADSEGLDLVSSEEADGGFLEWAADQTDSSETST